MKIIFCLSYLSGPITISIVESSNDDFLIVTSNPALVTFFKKLYQVEKIFLLKPIPLISKNPFKIVRNIFNVQLYKKRIRAKFHKYSSNNVYFFAVAYCEFESWLLKELSIKNQIYYKPSVSIEYLQQDHSIQAKVGKLIRKIIYSIDFIPSKTGTRRRYIIRQKFLQQIDARPFILDINNKLVSKKIIEHLKEFQNSKILILCGWVADAFVEKQEYIRVIDALIDLLENQYGYESLAIKTHPQRPEYYSRENDLKKIPSDIPANLLLDHFDVVIGYASSTLIEAVSAGRTAISLIKLIHPMDYNVRYLFIEYLNNNSKGSIHYPDNINNVISIIEQY